MGQYRRITNSSDLVPDGFEFTLWEGRDLAKKIAEWERPFPAIHFAKGSQVGWTRLRRGLGHDDFGRHASVEPSQKGYVASVQVALRPDVADARVALQVSLFGSSGSAVQNAELNIVKGEPAVSPVDMGGNTSQALAAMAKISQELKVASAYMPGTQEAPTNVTLGQWESHERIDVESRSDLEDAIEFYVLRPIVESAYGMMAESGHLQAAAAHIVNDTPPQLNDGTINIRFTGFEQALTRRRNVERLGQFVLLSTQYEQSPQLQAFLPRKKFYPQMQRDLGLPPSLINTPAEAEAYIAKQMEQVKAAQQQAAPPQ